MSHISIGSKEEEPAWKKVPEVKRKNDVSNLPKPRTINQYEEPIGPVKEEKEGLFKRTVRALNPEAPAAATAAGKGAVKKVKAAGPNMLQNLGKNVGTASMAASGPPVWLRDSFGGSGKKSTQRQVSGNGLPDWVMGRGAPWDPQGQRMAGGGDHGEVVKVVVTRTHADGTKTRSTRKPKGARQDTTPNLFRMPY